jgi:adenine deaminase
VPAAVIARGRLVARDGRLLARVPEPAWSRIFTVRSTRFDRPFQIRAEELELPSGPVPVIALRSAVITALEHRPPADGDLHAVLLDRRGEWITTAAVAGFARDLDGLATTLSTDHQVLGLGRRTDALARAVNRVLARRGGTVLIEGDRIVFELHLPVAGIMSRLSLPEAAQGERELQALLAARGHRFHDPLYTLLFMTADFLPAVRLTGRGIWDVKAARVIRPSRRRRR